MRSLSSLWPASTASPNPALVVATAILLLAVSSYWVVPRILQHPLPEDLARYHHHVGDGSGEMGSFAAHAYWHRHGALSTKLVPCMPKDLEATACTPYTHFPPGTFLMSAALLEIFGYPEAGERAVQWVRFVLYVAGSFGCALAVVLLVSAFGADSFWAFALAFALGATRGFVIYADNIDFHAITLALQGIALGILLAYPADKKYLGLFFGAATGIFWTTVELLPFLLLAPALLFWKYTDKTKARREALRYFLTAAAAIGIGIFLRFIQNAALLGDTRLVFEDWSSILLHRITGAALPAANSAYLSPPVTAPPSFSFLEYVLAQKNYQWLMLTKPGQYATICGALYLLWQSRAIFSFYLVAAFICVSWNFTFVQHSWVHLFTARFVIWPMLLAVLLALHVSGVARALRAYARNGLSRNA